MRVRLFDARREYELAADELREAAMRVLATGRYILGPEVAAFEREAAAYLGVQDAVGVASGTDALSVSLRALDIGPADAVVTSPFTFFATASAICMTGALPVFCDVNPATLNLEPTAVQALLDGKSSPHRRLNVRLDAIKAVIPVHLFGQPADMTDLQSLASSHGLFVVEDGAQAFGSEFRGRKVGTLGDVGCFSFFPTKNLGGFGDGGLVTTDDEALAAKVRSLRAHGSDRQYHSRDLGTNSRLDEMQAAPLRVRLSRLDRALEARQRHAASYDFDLAGIRGISPPTRAAGRTHTFHQYVIRVHDSRDALASGLRDAGIETAVHYPLPLHLQPALAALGYQRGDLPIAESAAESVLSLPIFPSLTNAERDEVVASLRRLMV